MGDTEKTVYRVHLEGLTPTERTVFAGLVLLTEHNPTYFQIETALDNADVVILDGSVRRSQVLSRLNNRLAQRTIWIDPGEDVEAVHRVSRPLRWSLVFELMEQIVSQNAVTPTVVNQTAGSKLGLDQWCALSQDVLRMHIGIATDFVVQQAVTEVLAAAGTQARLRSTAFFESLMKQLPASADHAKIAAELSKALAQAHTE